MENVKVEWAEKDATTGEYKEKLLFGKCDAREQIRENQPFEVTLQREDKEIIIQFGQVTDVKRALNLWVVRTEDGVFEVTFLAPPQKNNVVSLSGFKRQKEAEESEGLIISGNRVLGNFKNDGKKYGKNRLSNVERIQRITDALSRLREVERCFNWEAR